MKVAMEGPGVPPSVWYAFVVKEQGQYRMRAVSGALADVGQEAFDQLHRGRRAVALQWLGWARELVSAPAGDDPLRTVAWQRLWDDGRGDPELAAAALCLTRCGERATGLLEKARADATGERRTVLDQALAQGYWLAKRYDDMLASAERLLAAHATSSTARWFKQNALWHKKDYGGLEAYLAQAVEQAREAEIPALTEALAGAQNARGKLEKAIRTRQALIDAGRADAETYNNRAWASLFNQTANDQVLGYALRAAQLTHFTRAASLHTLAAVYAELGKTEEALQTLTKLLELRPRGEPLDVDWYVVGRLAEHYGIPDAAEQAYRRVQSPELDLPTTAYRLAKKRLERLP